MAFAKPIAEYESVASWRQGLRDQWGGDPLAEEPEKLSALADFCEFVAKDPDELLAFCFLRKKQSGERFVSTKRREQVAAWLREWRDRSGKSGVEARRAVSVILSFLIHCGVQMHPGMV